MWFFESLANVLGTIASTFRTIAEYARDIWFVGETIGDWFDTVAYWFDDAQWYMEEVDSWADDIAAVIGQYLTWDGIRSQLEDWLPWLNWTSGDWTEWLFDQIIDRLASWFEDRTDWVWTVGEKVLNRLW